jgi:LCP family protein required for cell wall assembly
MKTSPPISSPLQDAVVRRMHARFGAPRAQSPFRRGFTTGFVGGIAALVLFLLAAVMLFPPPRTNILLLGIDRRPEDQTFVSRTDTVILMTVSARQGYVGMLSIPRDLWVKLPNGNEGRINTAHVHAEVDQRGSGPAAVMETVRQNFGVDVHHYVRLDFQGFVKIIDALGGIEIDIPKPLVDNAYPTDDYGIQRVEFNAGRQWLSGERALIYARIRHGDSDFQRAERQGAVIRAFVARLLQPTAWPRFPATFAAVRESVTTDLTPFDMIRLAPAFFLVGPSGLDQRVLKDEMVQSYTTASGASVLLPVWENINPLLQEMFGQ